jgi:glucose-6-phosphate isomerase
VQRRFLRDMRGFYADAEAEAALEGEDPLVYEVTYGWNPPETPGQLGYCTTVIQPGQVGREYFMTKGHTHAKPECAEIYYGLHGEGRLILQTPEGEVQVLPMLPGTVSYVPPHWAHRTVNVGTGPFVFFSIFPADAGYDYGIIAREGFASIVVAGEHGPAVVANPRWRGGR